MHQRLSSLHEEVVSARTGHMPQRCEQAIGMAALAGFIGYLTAGAAQLQAFKGAFSDIKRSIVIMIRDARVRTCNLYPQLPAHQTVIGTLPPSEHVSSLFILFILPQGRRLGTMQPLLCAQP